ncbi:MAG: RsmE family RNA methyltransferase, partial [Treponema socranskii subsp. buccale]
PMTLCRIDDVRGIAVLQKCGSEGVSVSRGVGAADIDRDRYAVEYTLFQFIAKPQKMEIIIRQACECGVKTIVPVAGEYSQKGNVASLAGKTERFTRIIKEAREQSGSPVETVVAETVDVRGACDAWKRIKGEAANASAAVVLSERSDFCAPLSDAVFAGVTCAAIAVGCEGGISPRETEALRGAGFTSVHFAGNILRCETAALYGIAALQTALAEFAK